MAAIYHCNWWAAHGLACCALRAALRMSRNEGGAHQDAANHLELIAAAAKVLGKSLDRADHKAQKVMLTELVDLEAELAKPLAVLERDRLRDRLRRADAGRGGSFDRVVARSAANALIFVAEGYGAAEKQKFLGDVARLYAAVLGDADAPLHHLSPLLGADAVFAPSERTGVPLAEARPRGVERRAALTAFGLYRDAAAPMRLLEPSAWTYAAARRTRRRPTAARVRATRSSCSPTTRTTAASATTS